MTHFILSLLEQYGYPVLFFCMLIGIVGVPVPLEFLLFFSGSLTAQLGFSLLIFMGIAWAGAFGGMMVNYAIGRRIGLDRLSKYTAWLHITEARWNNWVERFLRTGPFLILIGFYITGLRHATPLLAGTSKYPFIRYAGYSGLGSLLWVSVFVVLGHYMGGQWERLYFFLHHPVWIAVMCVGVFAVATIYYGKRRKKPI